MTAPTGLAAGTDTPKPVAVTAPEFLSAGQIRTWLGECGIDFTVKIKRSYGPFFGDLFFMVFPAIEIAESDWIASSGGSQEQTKWGTSNPALQEQFDALSAVFKAHRGCRVFIGR